MQNGFGAFMHENASLPSMQHAPARRLSAHAAALEPPHLSAAARPQFAYPEQTRASPGPDISNWAADFGSFSAQLQNSGFPQQAVGNPQMSHAPTHMNFAAAFAQPQPQAFAPMFQPLGGGSNSFMRPQPIATNNADFDLEMSQWMAANGAGGNMKDVDAAMDQMARELELNEAVLSREEAETLTATAAPSDLQTLDMGNLTLTESQLQTGSPLEETTADPHHGKSAVSEAAERLLESVQHEGGEKWKNSMFLSLMRDFRDGRKDIVGDEIRQTGEGDEANGNQNHNNDYTTSN